MIQLESLFSNPFDDLSISMANFRQFGFDHNGKLATNNPGGIYTARIAATDAAFKQFDAVYSSKTVEEAMRKGATFGLGDFTGKVLTEARLLEKLVTIKFGNPSQVYLQFFPRGLTEFNNAGKGEWPALLARLKGGTEKHKTILGLDEAAKYAAFESGYNTAEGTQVEKKGSVEDLRNAVVQKRGLMAVEIFTNFLTIGLNNVGNPTVIKSYFDQTIVDRKQSSATDGKGRFFVKVTDHNGNPLSSVKIDIKDLADQNILLNQKTDANGQFKSTSLPIGFYWITFSLSSYETRSHRFEVFDNNDPENEVQLTKE